MRSVQLNNFPSQLMASVSVIPASGVRDPSGNTAGVDKLPEEMNDMRIRDDKVNDSSYSSCSLPFCTY